MSRLMKKVRSLAVVVAGMLVFGANAGTFLNDLATNANKVASSEYATGGDVILKLDDYTWVHVFTNAAASATFTANQPLGAQVLLVAGGGGGASGYYGQAGGGGAGGMVEDTAVTFASGVDYTVTVGKGGDGTKGNDVKHGGQGGDSSVTGGALDVETAVGGGGAGGFHNGNPLSDSIKGGNGGSGGGAGGSGSSSGIGGQPVDGQGHAGGSCYAIANFDAAGGGGGGAGSEGGNGTMERAGCGGDGRMSRILGFAQYFAGGGGGASGSKYYPGSGGLGGGGEGTYRNRATGQAGEDGLGGGGGGAYCTDNNHSSGKGGSGIVAIRYTVYDGAAPLLGDVSATLTDNRVVRFDGALKKLGADGSSVDVTVECHPADDESAAKTATIAEGLTIAANEEISFSCLVTQLKVGTTYAYTVTAKNDLGAESAVEGTFMTGSTKIALTVSGGEEGVDYEHLTEVGGTDEVYIFKTPNKEMSFTVTAGGFARLLLVAGGGGGYGMARSSSDGGGGAGGLLYEQTFGLKAGTYALKIGAGGAKSSSWNNYPGNGGDTTLSNPAAGVDFSVLGGGGAGGNNNAGKDGGSGGGGGYKLAGGHALVLGYGNDGGSSTVEGGCGGGGAGGAGGGAYKMGTTTYAGAGGAPISLDITGEMVDYAGGGGGGVVTGYHGAGGGTSGGQGASVTEGLKATSGKDGTGGGGGGANGANGGFDEPGKGGSGTVIIRFTDFSKLSDKPVFSAAIANVTQTSVDVVASITSLGDSDSADIYVDYGYAEDALTETVKLAEGVDKSGTLTLTGLSPARTYYLRARLDNGKGGIIVSDTYSFTTMRVSDGFGIGNSGRVYTFSTILSAVGSGTTTVNLYLNQGETTDVVAESKEAVSAGTISFTRSFANEDFGKVWYARIEIVNAEGDHEWVTAFPDKEFTPINNATFTWVSDVAEGWFDDSSSWTSKTDDGYPVLGSTAIFAAGQRAVVKLRGNAKVKDFNTTAKNLDITFRGEGETMPTLSMTDQRGDYLWGNDGGNNATTVTIDHVSYNPNVGAAWPKWGKNVAVIFKNGATWSLGCGLEPYFNEGSLLSVESGASVSATSFHGGRNGELRVDNGTLVFGDYANAAQGGAAERFVIRGTNSLFQVKGNFSHSCTFLFDVPGSLVRTPVVMDRAFPASGTVTITVPTARNAAIRKAPKQEITLLSAPSIKVGQIVFGTPARDKDYFYFAESEAKDAVQYRTAAEATASGKTMKYIRYHHESPLGTAIFLR